MLKSQSQSTSDSVRLKSIRTELAFDQKQMAAEIGIDRTYLSQLERGRKPVQKWVIEKAESLLKQAHLLRVVRNGVSNSAAEFLAAYEFSLTQTDLETGTLNVRLDYRRGAPAKGWPEAITLTRPKKQHAVALLADALDSRDMDPILKACLPPSFRTDEALDQLSPLQAMALERAAVRLTYGLADGDKVLTAIVTPSKSYDNQRDPRGKEK